jgi:ATP phosphoribosyltransferase regulatory subunit
MTHDPAPALLPRGFADRLPPHAGRRADAAGRMLAVFGRFGYARIDPPLAEFTDTLLAPGAGAALAERTFRTIDPDSGRVLGLRADITPQVARIAGGRLAGERRPLRLCYAAEALRTRTRGGSPRQICQVGCEVIGGPDGAVVEAMLLAVLALAEAGLDTARIVLDVTLPGRAAGHATTPQGRAAIEARDGAAIARHAPGAAALLGACGPLAAFAELAPLHAELAGALAAYGLSGVALTVDPLETRGFDYHEGVGFALFARGAAGELGRGGRYRLPSGEAGAGATLYLERVVDALPEPAPGAVARLPADAPWADVRAAQEGGRAVARG